MEIKMFAIYDEKALLYRSPFTFPERGMALRVFSDLANDPRTDVGRHPIDYHLYEIGAFDDKTGELLNMTNVALSRASDLVAQNGNGGVFSFEEEK